MLQQSEEWHEFRRAHIGASEAATIWGDMPAAWYAMWEDKMGVRVNNFDNAAMQHGRETEPKAREWFSNYIGRAVWPDVKESENHPFLSASLDGISTCGKILWEVKCPTSRRILECAEDGEILCSHQYQLQQQMYVYDVDEIFYNIYFTDDDSHIFKLKRNDAWLKEYIVKAKKFWGYVERGEPPFSEWESQDWLDTETWMLGLMKKEEDLKEKLKAIDLEKKSCIETLRHITSGQSGVGPQIILTQCKRKGAVNYRSIPELKDIDLERYRKDDILFWKVAKRKF